LKHNLRRYTPVAMLREAIKENLVTRGLRFSKSASMVGRCKSADVGISP